MLEIELRFKFVTETLESSTFDQCKLEVGMLHLRQLVEVLAMACLVAQGDYQTQRAFREEHSPAAIFKALAAHYPRFFPQPATAEHKAGKLRFNANSKPAAYRMKDAISLWNRSGDHLHRASLDKYLKRSNQPPPALDVVTSAWNGLWALLECHVVRIETERDRETVLIVRFRPDGSVSADFAELDPDIGEWARQEGFDAKRD